MAERLEDYHSEKSKLLNAIRRLEKLDKAAGARLEKIAGNLEAESFVLAVLGQFKRGKSTLVNAILGEPLLPTAVLPLTSIITIIRHGDKTGITVVYKNGDEHKIRKNEIGEYVTEKGNPNNIKGVERVEITLPSEFLSRGITLVDTPGIGSAYRHNTDITYQFLPDVDAALFVVSADPPISEAECAFLEESVKYASKFFFVLNKVDYLGEEDARELLEFTKNMISQKTGGRYGRSLVLPLSAKCALEARMRGDKAGLKRSGLPALEKEVERFVVAEKGEFILRSCKSRAIAVAQEMLNGRMIEKKALERSQKELEELAKRFEEELEGILSRRNYGEDMLGLEQKGIMGVLDKDLAELKRRALHGLTDEIARYVNSLEKRGNAEFAAAVDAYRQERVLHVLEHWRDNEEEKVSRAFSEKMRKYSEDVDETISRIEKLASGLFEVRIGNRRTDEALTLESRFYFKLSRVDDTRVSSMLEPLLPPPIFRKRLVSRIPQDVEEDLEMNAGRMRSDFMERMEKSALDFGRELNEKTDLVIAGIRGANERALAIKKGSGGKAEERISQLEREIAELEGVIGSIGQQAATRTMR